MAIESLQSIYRTSNVKALPGMEVKTGLEDDELFVNDHPRTSKIVTVTVDTAVDDTDYAVEVMGVTITAKADEDIPDTPSKTEVRDALISVINNEPLVNATVRAEANNADDFTITAKIAGQDFDFSESDTNLSANTTQNDAQANTVEFGRAVELNGLGTDSGLPLARKVDAANFTKREQKLTLDGYAAGTYTVVIEVNGETLVAQTTNGGDVATVLGNLQTDIAAHNLLDANVNGSDLEVKAATAGFADFDIVSFDTGSSGQVFSFTEVAEGSDINELFAGVTVREADLEADDDNDPNLAGYPPQENMTVRQYGKLAVKTEGDVDLTANPQGTVYVRLSANGSLDQLGTFRSDYNSGCVPLKAARFVAEINSELDIIKVQR